MAEPGEAGDAVLDGEADICKNVHAGQMHISTPGRRKFDSYYAWKDIRGPG